LLNIATDFLDQWLIMWNLLRISNKSHEKVRKNLYLAFEYMVMKSIEKVRKNLFNASDSRFVFRCEEK